MIRVPQVRGQNLTKDQGRDLYVLRDEATMLNTLLAMRRNRPHAPRWLMLDGRLGVLQAAMDYYAYGNMVTCERMAEILAGTEPANEQVQTVSVVEVSK